MSKLSPMATDVPIYKLDAAHSKYGSPQDDVGFHIVVPAKADIQHRLWIPAKSMPE